MNRDSLKENKTVKRFMKSPLYARIRQRFSMPDMYYTDDRDRPHEAETILIDWPQEVRKPVVGVIRDYDRYPRWTKYCRFLENNAIPYEIYDLHSVDWMEKARDLDVFVGIVSNEFHHLQEMREKYFILEHYLGKMCFPSLHHILLYEDKALEAYISKAIGIPFVPTHIFHNETEALRRIETMRFPVVSKINPGSGSMGVELVRDQKQAARIVKESFSRKGRATHSLYYRQKNCVYFQDYIPNDGYDIRVILAKNWAFGFYRKVLEGDFRASGMGLEEFRELPEEAVRIAWRANKIIRSPLLVVDMVHSLDGHYYVIEFSPICQLIAPNELRINGVAGAYVIEEDESIRFQEGRYWVHELSLREFLLSEYLPMAAAKKEIALR